MMQDWVKSVQIAFIASLNFYIIPSPRKLYPSFKLSVETSVKKL